ncbi:hypothetical protein NLX67_19480 [Domibacillus sp. A3M-37]|uniref:hypothetical protein n=1 Tax=Domibacillus sp. A3M-37 TaxID=2962037 RepID=UPI0020B741B5|nr:hypothetical protein [Domibacillus sp. A3M-37]MCP3764528.1 hypothetical protein [Domibacillus sp. A3M-37]
MIRVAFLLNVVWPVYIADFKEDGTLARNLDGEILDPGLSEKELEITFEDKTVILAIKHLETEKELWDERARLANEHRVYKSRIQLLFLDPNKKPVLPPKEEEDQ